MAVCQNLVPLVNIKIAGKWMFIPLKMVLIGIDPYPDVEKPWFPVRKKVPIHLGSPNSCAKSSCSASKLRASGGNPVKFRWRCFFAEKNGPMKSVLLGKSLYYIYIYIIIYRYHINMTSIWLCHHFPREIAVLGAGIRNFQTPADTLLSSNFVVVPKSFNIHHVYSVHV